MSTSTLSAPAHLPSWPPEVSPEQLDHLLLLATTHALTNGFILLAPPAPTPGNPPTQTFAAPMSIFPTPFPRRLFDRVRLLQPIYNVLYARVALDWEFIDGVFQGVSRVDDFQGALWRGWKSIREDLVQDLQLGIFRSDYLLHDTGDEKPLAIKQVEFNTIASSFGALSQRAGELHRYLARATNGYYNASPEMNRMSNYPENHSLELTAEGLSDAWKMYGRTRAAILFVVQPTERNIFDQRWLEYELMAKNDGLRVLRHTMRELEDLAQVEQLTQRLYLPCPEDPYSSATEIAVVYYRAGYGPNDYSTGSEWDTRLLLERSRAIKCPSMALQLAGAKKIQQVLAEPGKLEEFLLGENQPDVGFGAGAGKLNQNHVDMLRETWIGLYPMNSIGLEMALNHPELYVLKPQREGGGNNIYREDIPEYLASLEGNKKDTSAAYILMEMIEPPPGVGNLLLKGGEKRPKLTEVVRIVNREAGTLLRTKGRDSDEGGVAIGISSIDSPFLVE
ncbi:hypothetical protein TREMEDRAFT_64014 [Tremella mesenterica DSM 1558]|uniref:uncharacterized protein n=1 Tax=Tremella mesenterica (strain ATCC 24925 / CBS 8224 / DSM 1558 / NBRC 9311 / NRRL Y-6157 / RJB 2259-6 / UBC 559-6) TaxID=578456 RepID=UPI0003F49697|nr:uncharacterized protein TREMEDRAFT_64014 [Tremella mesenterica DSM 1558]EIW68118.1 hypothetical protein TREMEDRAFT_64014 [Tremella mesenterica DSM 1558]